jgi:hypothetical protein
VSTATAERENGYRELARRRRRLRAARSLPALTLDELVTRSAHPAEVVEAVMHDELRRRRVWLDGSGHYRLVVDRF